MENKMRMAYRILMIAFSVTLVAGIVTAQEAEASTGETVTKETMAQLGAGIALAGCGIGTGLAQGPIGAAAVGMIAEDGSKFGVGLLFTVLPETIVLFGFLSIYLLG
ncbi:MAG: hypothetical protein QF911_04575 [Candidatus Thalassarchaeaceae archaeon]|jgi:V/A-type H+-transporting ATPase subunit K|nr:hypothetical protein [Candidatus Thalassarchaeaceae archaeon]|tara:strand:- start:4044 stop:4364 length:321 start_codon:yes stop_codon:yes gene_type:complete